ncbi:MAG TPA: hypothetical protein VKA75_18235 [Reyranella sp.]|jgi:hypothetical protein|nr:hypothetical protein [Reyranella sp.]
MAKNNPGVGAPKATSAGKHGGNRAGDRSKKADGDKRSSQAAGKDPNRKTR